MPADPTLMLARLIGRATRRPAIRAWLRRLAEEAGGAQAAARAIAAEVPETLAIDARPAAAGGRSRLNLLVPAISQRHLFGGIETALQVFDALRSGFDGARIVVTDETAPRPRPGAWYADWPVVQLDDEPPPVDHVVVAGSRWAKSLAVHELDYFMATAWWTAHNGFSLLDWQRRTHPGANARRLLYLIQDYEPGFYAWGSRWVLARATYERGSSTVALVNSGQLARYLDSQGHSFASTQVLEPQFHPVLRDAREASESFRKERMLLVYGRPGTERNGFALVVDALRRWVREHPDAPAWSIVSAGESFDPIELGRGCALRSLGKLGIDEYAGVLARSALGLSLMISPHPSYTPLEMAAFGARVVTNRFGPKDLSSVSSFITSVDLPDPASLASSLAALAAGLEARVDGGLVVERSEIDAGWQGAFLRRPGLPTDWMAEVPSLLAGA